jgi:hypothetical protein
VIQVCSTCGTRWNVRDKQRQWCPRCQGALLPPSSEAPAGPPPNSGWNRPAGAPPAHGLPPGYRWIAVRPGAAPPPHRSPRPLGPTPRYTTIPRWGLVDPIVPVAEPEQPVRTGPSSSFIRGVLYATVVVLLAAGLIHAVRYLLLIINRSVLLPAAVAWPAVWLGVIASIAVLFAVIACAVTMTGWLIRRRAAVYAHRGQEDPRSALTLWAGCLTPVVNLVWAPVFAVETAVAEERASRLRKPILVWAVLWVMCTAVSIFAIATSFTADAQGIADNTVTITLAYLLGAATVVALTRVYYGFDRKPVERPAHRWVVVADAPVRPNGSRREKRSKSEQSRPTAGAEPGGQEPAA